MARANAVDLVEIAPNANPPVCRLVDFGKYRYEQAKRDKESKKHQHANKVKEVQLSPKIDPHDLEVKVQHAVNFLCEDMKVKITLKFRGREMAHTEYGFQVVNKFLTQIAPYGHPDFQPKLIGRGINVMISPLPRNKRAKNPRGETGPEAEAESAAEENHSNSDHVHIERENPKKQPPQPQPAESNSGSFANNPFAQVEARG